MSVRVLAFLALLLPVSCGGGGSSGGPPPPPPSAGITVTPASAEVAVNGTEQFSAKVTNSAETSVTWEVNRIANGNAQDGEIDANGLYTAPALIPNPSTVAVTAVLASDPSVSGSAQITVTPPPSLTPQRAALTTSQTQQFDVVGPNWSNTSVTWAVDGVAGGNLSAGTIDSNGLYVPGTAGMHLVQATSKTDATETATSTVYVTAFAGTLSWRNNPEITGENTQEVALSPSVLTGGEFGKLFSCPVDGYVYAQPLYVPNLSIPGDRTRNVVFVATEHDSVYAFDADANPCQQPLWKTSFLSPGVTTVPYGDVGTDAIAPEIGITGTPVIDPTTHTLYVVAKTREGAFGAYTYVQRLHALDLFTGEEKFGGPVEIRASVPGTGDGNNGLGTVPFVPLIENQRAALQLAGGQIYVAFESNGDNGLYHGWLLVYDAAALTQTAAFNATPDGAAGGIWQGGAAPSVDVATGDIFLGAGNGTFDANSSTAPNDDYGDSLLRLVLNASPGSLSVVDSFTPYNQAYLAGDDLDLASTGVLLLPGTVGSTLHPHLALIGGKAGVLYLVDRDHLGGYTPGGPDSVIQEIVFFDRFMSTPAYWNGHLYAEPAGETLQEFSVANGAISGSFSSQSPTRFPYPGSSPVVSSDGTSNGIVWALDNGGYSASPPQPTVLHAYDANNIGTELYSSAAHSADAAGPAVKFTVPTVANGKVYVGTENELTVYGLLPGP